MRPPSRMEQSKTRILGRNIKRNFNYQANRRHRFVREFPVG
jgi:hypothetical protein